MSPKLPINLELQPNNTDPVKLDNYKDGSCSELIYNIRDIVSGKKQGQNVPMGVTVQNYGDKTEQE